MTLSGQTNSTTLNILLGVRRSDLRLPFPPSPPTFFQVCCLCFFALFRWAPQHFLLPLAAVVWGPFCFGGVLPSWPPYLHVLFVCGPTWVMLSLPSFVLSLTFRSRLGFAFLGSWLCQSGASACVFLVPLCLCRAPLRVWLGPVVSVLSFGSCGPPSLPDVASLPPAVGPVWRPGPVCTLVPPSGYLVASVTAWLPCFTAGSVVVLCRPYFILSHGSKGFWPCVGFVSPSPPCCMCC